MQRNGTGDARIQPFPQQRENLLTHPREIVLTLR